MVAPGEPRSKDEIREQLDSAVLPRYGLTRVTEPEPISGGTLNWNFHVGTSRGEVFARRHRSGLSDQQIRAEHEVIAWVSGRGIPVACPFATKDGATVVVAADALWSLAPWIEGRPPVRGATTVSEAAALGEMHGRIQAALRLHPTNAIAPPFVLNEPGRSEVVARFAAVRDAASKRGLSPDVVGFIEEQAELASRFSPDGWPALDVLSVQLVHGDYHNEQVLMSGEAKVEAVVDWELFRRLPRVHELIRSLSFSQLLSEPRLVEAYLAAYGEHVTLSPAECARGVELWWFARLRNTWAYEAFLFEGNERVEAFFPVLIKDLRQLADPEWREALVDTMIRLTCGRASR